MQYTSTAQRQEPKCLFECFIMWLHFRSSPSLSSHPQVLVWHTRTEKPVLVNEGKKGFTDSNVEIWHTSSDTGERPDLEMQITIASPHWLFGRQTKGERFSRFVDCEIWTLLKIDFYISRLKDSADFVTVFLDDFKEYKQH